MPVFKLIPWRLALRDPLRLPGGARLTHREGLLLHDPVTGGWGDAAPLPGFSTETLEQVNLAAKSGNFDDPALPSLRFAAECAREPVRGTRSPARVNFLWMPDQESPDDLVKRVAGSSPPSVKIKPGPLPDVGAILQLTHRLPGVRLRLDANRQWDMDTTLRVWEALPPGSLEYIEEPLASPGDYPALWSRAPVPVALDETLRQAEGNHLARDPRVVALVLKPTLLGNGEDCARWIRLGIPVVWSSCFESGVGLWRLAERAENSSVACGLDTARVFREDLVDPVPLPVDGAIPPAAWKVVVP